jgi:hypothetical protein
MRTLLVFADLSVCKGFSQGKGVARLKPSEIGSGHILPAGRIGLGTPPF